MKDSEEIRFLEGTCQESSAELQVAQDRERVESAKRRQRWALGALVWAILIVPPAAGLCAAALPSPAGVIGAGGFAATGLVALAYALKGLMRGG